MMGSSEVLAAHASSNINRIFLKTRFWFSHGKSLVRPQSATCLLLCFSKVCLQNIAWLNRDNAASSAHCCSFGELAKFMTNIEGIVSTRSLDKARFPCSWLCLMLVGTHFQASSQVCFNAGCSYLVDHIEACSVAQQDLRYRSTLLDRGKLPQ